MSRTTKKYKSKDGKIKPQKDGASYQSKTAKSLEKKDEGKKT